MSRPKPSYTPDPRFWNDFQIAARLGMGEEKFRKLRPDLEREHSFPRRDALLLDQTDSKAVEAWLDANGDDEPELNGRAGWVYFVLSGDAVKIGFTDTRPDIRLKALQTGNPQELVLVGAIKGRSGLERTLHQAFAHLRIRGEWFRWTNEIAGYAETHEDFTPWISAGRWR